MHLFDWEMIFEHRRNNWLDGVGQLAKDQPEQIYFECGKVRVWTTCTPDENYYPRITKKGYKRGAKQINRIVIEENGEIIARLNRGKNWRKIVDFELRLLGL